MFSKMEVKYSRFWPALRIEYPNIPGVIGVGSTYQLNVKLIIEE
jgi:hypothetical protein